MKEHKTLKIGFVRRGYARSGGAEAYLKRLAQGVAAAGHELELFTTSHWPVNEWPFGPITRVGANSPIAFADRLERVRPRAGCDVLMSLERVWHADVFRAGDGVHRVWLAERDRRASRWQRLIGALTRKQGEILRLEAALLGEQNALTVIANSEMVKDQIVRTYGYPAERIEVIYNGVPLDAFARREEARASTRASHGLAPDDLALLFLGSGWERKGLRYAVQAVEQSGLTNAVLLVAGRGEERKYRSSKVKFLGVVREPIALLQAADIFILPTIYDPFSNACLEALAAGLPVITTRGNGFSEVIEEGVHGSILAEPTDVASIVQALQFWAEPARRAAARPHLLGRAADFDISKNVELTLRLLFQAAEKAEAVSGKMRKT
jgi:UDP-glucose:(heptosyl)LPS alpha-1,3-glucosyltransferase